MISISYGRAAFRKHHLVMLLVGCVGGALVGCDRGPKIVPASGVVVFGDGSPVTVGTVETKSALENGYQATGKIQPDGSFVLSTLGDGDGAVVGEHQCVVVQFVMAEEVKGHKASTLGVVNPIHNSYATSGLSISIPESGTKELKIVVKGIQASRGVDSKHKPITNDGNDPSTPPK